MEAIEAGRTFVEQRFPECLAAFVAGSFLRGEATPTSDLDIVVIAENEDAPYRESLRAYSWPIEVFVHTQESLQTYFAEDLERRRPSLVLMCSEGVVVCDRDGLAHRIKEEATALIERGPEPFTSEEIMRLRYAITDLLDDFLGCDRFEEGMFIAHDLAADTADLLLAYNRKWTGSGKWVPRALKRFDPELARQLTDALTAYYQTERKEDLVQFVDGVLDLVGGRLFEGYRSAGKRDTNSEGARHMQPLDNDADTPIEDLFDFDQDQVDFTSAESFPASDPPPGPSTIAPTEESNSQ